MYVQWHCKLLSITNVDKKMQWNMFRFVHKKHIILKMNPFSMNYYNTAYHSCTWYILWSRPLKLLFKIYDLERQLTPITMVIKLIILSISLINSKTTIAINNDVQTSKHDNQSVTSLIPLDEWFTRVSDPTYKCVDHEQELEPGFLFVFILHLRNQFPFIKILIWCYITML